ncbi:MAG: hypothetical protein AAGC68_17915 [Verrucomicrobiota bacterium]
MSDVFEENLEIVSGKLGQMIHENPGEGAEPSLRFFLEVAFTPFEWEEETLTPLLRVDNIVVEGLLG